MRADPLYLGVTEPRLRGHDYLILILMDEFVAAVEDAYPRALIADTLPHRTRAPNETTNMSTRTMAAESRLLRLEAQPGRKSLISRADE